MANAFFVFLPMNCPNNAVFLSLSSFSDRKNTIKSPQITLLIRFYRINYLELNWQNWGLQLNLTRMLFTMFQHHNLCVFLDEKQHNRTKLDKYLNNKSNLYGRHFTLRRSDFGPWFFLNLIFSFLSAKKKLSGHIRQSLFTILRRHWCRYSFAELFPKWTKQTTLNAGCVFKIIDEEFIRNE